MIAFTTVYHEFRKQRGLSLSEYVFLDIVFILCNPSIKNSKVPGWCYMSRESLAEEMGITKQTVLQIIERLEKKKFLIKDPETKYLQTTPEWQQVYFGKENLPIKINGKESVPNNGKETLLKDGKETLPKIYKVENNKENNKREGKKTLETKVSPAPLYERKVQFLKTLIEYQESKPTKYPKQMIFEFGRWWGEAGKKKMKWEIQDTFEIPGRLAKWWEKTSDEEAGKMWETNKEYNLRSKFNELVKPLMTVTVKA